QDRGASPAAVAVVRPWIMSASVDSASLVCYRLASIVVRYSRSHHCMCMYMYSTAQESEGRFRMYRTGMCGRCTVCSTGITSPMQQL
uniref:Uncharacterized protein n=1 Tax=Aegilops tauschii subsp. strangulata TaxID=200361 RepID=A0A453LQY8_AEGTS